MKHLFFFFSIFMVWFCFAKDGRSWGKPRLVMSQLWCNVAARRTLGPCPWPLNSVNSLLCSSGRALGTQARSGPSVCSVQGSSEAAPLHLFRSRAQMLPGTNTVMELGESTEGGTGAWWELGGYSWLCQSSPVPAHATSLLWVTLASEWTLQAQCRCAITPR